MSLTDATERKSIKKRRAVGAKGKHWGESQKLEAVITYLTTGNLRLTASMLKIPEITVKSWKASNWWKETENELKLQEKLVVSERLKKIIEKSLGVIEDRLDKGEHVLNQKTGELIRKPVSMKDAHSVSMDLMKRRDYLIDSSLDAPEKEVAEDKLKQLAEKFAEIATQKIQNLKPTIEVTDVIEMTVQENTHAVHEEREARLQA